MNTLVPVPITYRAAVSHTRLTFSIEIKTAGRSRVCIYEPCNDGECPCGKGGLLLPSAGSALCVERNGSDKTGLRVRQRLWECWRLAYEPWLGSTAHRTMGQRRYLRQNGKSGWHTAQLPAIIVSTQPRTHGRRLKRAFKRSGQNRRAMQKGSFPWEKRTNAPE